MSANREVISGADVPSGIGPYSPAVRAGDLLFVSGQPGVDPTTAKPVGPDDFAALNGLFPDQPPARMVMQVPLPAGLRISIGCVAAVEA